MAWKIGDAIFRQKVMAPTRLELVTLGLLDLRSNQLSYGAEVRVNPEFPVVHIPAKSRHFPNHAKRWT